MDLCFDARMIESGGIGTYIKAILPAILRSFDTTLLGNPAILSKTFPGAQVIPFHAPLYSLREQLQQPFLLPRCRLFFAPHISTSIFPLRAKHLVTTIHDTYHLDHPEQFSLPKRAIGRLLYSRAMERSTKVITVSQFSRGRLASHFPQKQEKCFVIPNGVPSIYQRVVDPAHLQAIRNKYKLPQHFLLAVGNSRPNKNFARLIAAAQLLHLPLVMVSRRDRFLEELDGVQFTGYLPDVDLPPLYSLATLFVFPSLYEGFGLPPLEAMACGCPVVASSIGAIREICGDAVCYIDPLSTQDMAKKIKSVYHNSVEQRDLREKGYQRVLQFSIEQTSQSHLSLLKNLHFAQP